MIFNQIERNLPNVRTPMGLVTLVALAKYVRLTRQHRLTSANAGDLGMLKSKTLNSSLNFIVIFVD